MSVGTYWVSFATRPIKIMIDSGGIQKEAYILNIPCIKIRETKKWVEIVEDG
jgi:UDP-N-acetylglucosamine 2-epimerase (non-hydrolysing)